MTKSISQKFARVNLLYQSFKTFSFHSVLHQKICSKLGPIAQERGVISQSHVTSGTSSAAYQYIVKLKSTRNGKQMVSTVIEVQCSILDTSKLFHVNLNLNLYPGLCSLCLRRVVRTTLSPILMFRTLRTFLDKAFLVALISTV